VVGERTLLLIVAALPRASLNPYRFVFLLAGTPLSCVFFFEVFFPLFFCHLNLLLFFLTLLHSTPLVTSSQPPFYPSPLPSASALVFCSAW
jgi:hypothetical protein